jgi:hypothetical protein
MKIHPDKMIFKRQLDDGPCLPSKVWLSREGVGVRPHCACNILIVDVSLYKLVLRARDSGQAKDSYSQNNKTFSISSLLKR